MRIRIEHDDINESPRVTMDNVGVMACWHRQLKLGDRQPEEGPQEFEDALPNGTIILPLYLMNHSGLTMRTESFSCRWDSGQVGILYLTPSSFQDNFGVKNEENITLATKILVEEVKLYNYHLEQDCWGYIIEKADECGSCHNVTYEVIDACSGFLGDSLEVTGIQEHLLGNPEITKEQIKQAWEKRYEQRA